MIRRIMLKVVFLFCSAFVCAGPLIKSQAFDAVLGTSDPAELQRMAENPQKHWEERKAALFAKGQIINAPEFLDIFTRQTKSRCEELLKKFGSGGGWFEDLGRFEGLITSVFPKEDAWHKTIKATHYAHLCDFLLFHTTNAQKGEDISFLNSKTLFLRQLNKNKDCATPEAVNNNMVWILTKDGFFSMWDYLIVLSENLYLGSAAANVALRDDFSAHAGLFKAHSGILSHDGSHAEIAGRFGTILQRHGYNVGDYITECFGQKNTKNIIELGQKILFIFMKVHECAPHQMASLEAALTEKIPRPLDDFCEVLPFFMDVTTDVNDIPSQARKYTQNEMLQGLCSWHDQYFKEVNDKYLS